MARANIQEIQDCILSIYKEIKTICDRHNVQYFAIAGTAIGAVRHHGFIPWDDDLDIAMPAEDYHRFLTEYYKELPEHLQLIRPYASKNNSRQFLKVHDVRTTLIPEDNLTRPDLYYGIFVDIMPLYGIPKNAKFHNKHLYFLRSMDKLQRRDYAAYRQKGMPQAMLWLLAKPLNLLLPNLFWANRIEAYLNKFTMDNCTNTGCTWHLKFKRKEVFPVEWFSKSITMPFEDTEIMISASFDALLTQQFGDYMTPPPLDERINHANEGIVNTGLSYLEYIKDFNQYGTVKQR